MGTLGLGLGCQTCIRYERSLERKWTFDIGDWQSSAFTHVFINKLGKVKINQSEPTLNESVFTLKTTQDWVSGWVMHRWTSVQKHQDVDMETESGALTQWPALGGEVK